METEQKKSKKKSNSRFSGEIVKKMRMHAKTKRTNRKIDPTDIIRDEIEKLENNLIRKERAYLKNDVLAKLEKLGLKDTEQYVYFKDILDVVESMVELGFLRHVDVTDEELIADFSTYEPYLEFRGRLETDDDVEFYNPDTIFLNKEFVGKTVFLNKLFKVYKSLNLLSYVDTYKINKSIINLLKGRNIGTIDALNASVGPIGDEKQPEEIIAEKVAEIIETINN